MTAATAQQENPVRDSKIREEGDETVAAAKTVIDDAVDARDRFIVDLQNLAGHAQELMHVTTTISTEGVAAAREQLRQSLNVAGESIKKFQADTLDRGRKVVEQTDSYVHENPWQAIAIGMIAGLALGIAGGSMATRGIAARS